MEYNIGDYVEYNGNSSNTYHYNKRYGCIVEKDLLGYYSIIKQIGGQLCSGIEPEKKINERLFLFNFSLYDENKDKILKIKNILPENLKEKIKEKCLENIKITSRSVLEYSFKKYLQNKNEVVKISIESWFVEWYIIYILRSYDPDTFNDNLRYCYGSTDFIKQFMKENKDFIIDMQSNDYPKIMIYIIEEKILDFKYRLGQISINKLRERLFPIRKIKLNTYLKLKFPVEDKLVKVFFNKKYFIEMQSKDLFDAKIVFSNKYNNNYEYNKESKCFNKLLMTNNIIQINDTYEKDIINNKNVTYDKGIINIKDNDGKVIYSRYTNIKPVITNKYIYDKEIIDITTLKTFKIQHNYPGSIPRFNHKGDILIFADDCYKDDINTKLISLYLSTNGIFLGHFEFNYPKFENIYDVDIEM